MRSRAGCLALLVLLVLTAQARELLVNGDFELPVEIGWSEVAWGEFSDTGNCRLRRQHDFHPDRDYEVMVHKLLNKGYAIYQQVPVTTHDLGFSVSCRLTSRTDHRDYYAAAAVCLEYRDGADSVLGETRIFSATEGHSWRGSDVLHLIGAPDSLNWHDYRFYIGDELANLPGVNPADVRAVRIVLLAYVDRNG